MDARLEAAVKHAIDDLEKSRVVGSRDPGFGAKSDDLPVQEVCLAGRPAQHKILPHRSVSPSLLVNLDPSARRARRKSELLRHVSYSYRRSLARGRLDCDPRLIQHTQALFPYFEHELAHLRLSHSSLEPVAGDCVRRIVEIRDELPPLHSHHVSRSNRIKAGAGQMLTKLSCRLVDSGRITPNSYGESLRK